jgi:alanyl aminopeptidase
VGTADPIEPTLRYARAGARARTEEGHVIGTQRREDWRGARWLTVAALGVALCGCTLFQPAQSAAPRPAAAQAPLVVPTGQLPREVRPLGYSLELEIVPTRERFAGRAQIAVQIDRPTSIVWLHGKGFHVTLAQATTGGRTVPASWTQMTEDGIAVLNFGQTLPAGPALIEIRYDAAFERDLEGLYRVDEAGASYAFTQFEPISARLAFPCFDEPVFKAPFEVWLTVPKDDAVIANGHEVSVEPLGDLKRVRFAKTPPLPSYLVAFAVGPLDVVAGAPIPANEVRQAPVPLRGVAARGQGSRLAYALEHTGKILDALERYTGLPYPYAKLDLIAVPDFGPGAMENAGAVAFREWLLLVDPQGAPEHQKRAFAGVMAHELAHQWFGNLVTMPWWDDVWLNEAFATWLGHKIHAELHPGHRAELHLLESVQDAMQEDARVNARMIRQPIATTHDISNAFDSITYQKGAGVLAMLERWLGDEAFRSGLRKYLAAHAHGNATATHLVHALATSGEDGPSVGVAFGSFLDQAGVPFVEAEVVCAEGGKAELKLSQSRYLPVGSTGDRARTWQLPLCARYAVGGATHESCTLLDATQGSLALEGCPDWLVPNASGVGYYRWSLAAKDLAKLRRAWNQLSPRERLSTVDSLRAGFEGGRTRAEDLFAALEAIASDEQPAVAAAPMEILTFARDHLLDEASRPALAEYARKLYQPVLRRLGWADRPDEDGETKLLRAQTIAFLADVGEAAFPRQRAARAGRALLDAKDPPEPLAMDLRDLAVRLALEDGDDAVFDAAVTQFKAAVDPTERQRLLGALGSVHDARSAKALALALDPALKVNEVYATPRIQMRDPRTREAAWQWIEANFDALASRVSLRRAGYTPMLATSLCSEAGAARVEAFFAPRIQGMTGGPRTLAAALEETRLCAARVEAHKESARKFFAPAKAP